MGRKVSVKVEDIRKRWITTDELMKYLGISKDLVQHFRDSGAIRPHKLNNRIIWYDINEVDEYIAGLKSY